MLALAWILFSAQPTISVEIKATTAKLVFSQLSEKVGTDLEVDGKLQGEILIIRVEDVPRQDLLDKLAEVLNAEWQKTAKGLKLVRTPDITKRLQGIEQSEHLGRVEKLMAAHAKHVKSFASPTARAEAVFTAIETLHKQMENNPRGISLDGPRLAAPASTLVHELAMALGAKEIASVPPYSPVVYSNHPNRRQRALPTRAAEAFRAFEESQSALAIMIPEEMEKKPWLASPMYADIFKSVNQPIGKVHLGIHNARGFLSYSLTLYSESGNMVTSGFTNTWNLLGSEVTPPVRTRTLGAVPLSEASAEFAAHSSPNPDIGPQPGARKRGQPFSLALKQLFTYPEKRDPLGFAVTDAVMGLAGRKKKNLVACVPDSLIRAVREATKDDKIDLDSLVLILDSRGGCKLGEDENCLILRPSRPLASEWLRLARAPLGKYLRASYQDGRMTLENKAQFHFEAGEPASFSGLSRAYQSLLANTGIRPLHNWERYSHDFYAFIGSLSHGQRKTLNSGQALSLGQMVGVQRGLASGMMDRAGLGRTDGTTQKEVPDIMLWAIELFPNGGVGDSTMTMHTEQSLIFEQSIAIGSGGGGDHFRTASTFEEMANGLAAYNTRGGPIRLQSAAIFPYAEVRIGNRRSTVFTVQVAPGIKAVFDARSDDVDEKAKAVPLSDIPFELQKKLIERAEEIRKKKYGLDPFPVRGQVAVTSSRR